MSRRRERSCNEDASKCNIATESKHFQQVYDLCVPSISTAYSTRYLKEKHSCFQMKLSTRTYMTDNVKVNVASLLKLENLSSIQPTFIHHVIWSVIWTLVGTLHAQQCTSLASHVGPALHVIREGRCSLSMSKEELSIRRRRFVTDQRGSVTVQDLPSGYKEGPACYEQKPIA